jgi:hypothetical protein
MRRQRNRSKDEYSGSEVQANEEDMPVGHRFVLSVGSDFGYFYAQEKHKYLLQILVFKFLS